MPNFMILGQRKVTIGFDYLTSIKIFLTPFNSYFFPYLYFETLIHPKFYDSR